jgi:hypothetical protein
MVLRQTKSLLVDANINPKTLTGERPETALGLLDPQQPGVLDDLNRSLRTPGKKDDPLLLFSRFDADEARLVGTVVKTRGRMTFEKGAHASVVVHTDYTFVYPVARGDSMEVTRTIVRRAVDVQLLDPARYRVTPGKLQLARYDQSLGNSACDVHDGFLHPRFPSTAPGGADPTGPTTDPYDRSRELDTDPAQVCGSLSRT